MSEQTEVRTSAPITITLDVAELAHHLVPDYDQPYDGRWEDGGGPEPMGALDGILKHVANLIVASIRPEYVKAAADAATAEVHRTVSEIVERVLDDGAVVGTGFSKVEVKPIRDLISSEVLAFTTRTASNSGHGRETALQEMVRVQVDKALKTELVAVLDEQRVIFRAAVQETATRLIADAATKRV